jgi:hypothetical protein
MNMTALQQPNLVAAVAERIAIVLLLGGSAWLTFTIFMVEHSDLL